MRPLRLVMRAVGPFAGEQVVDFRLLRDRSFVLVHGPTGSGKTTILDALCYALYGVCSGADRDPNRIRSDFAPPSVLTEVTLDFALGRDVYRVYRRPEQETVGKRKGHAKARGGARLFKRTGLTDDNADGTVIAVKSREVTGAVEDLLGFKSDQFRQVVVLPQGEFRKFLAAGSADRERILEVLFQTERYRGIEEALKSAAKEVADNITDTRRAIALVLQESGSETADELQQRQMLDRARLDDVKERLEALKDAEHHAVDRLNHGKLILGHLNEHSLALDALTLLEQRIPAVEAKRADLVAARTAEAMVGREDALCRRIAEADEASKKVKAAQEAVEQAESAKASAELSFQTENGRQAERDGLKQEQGRLELLTKGVRELDGARKRRSLSEQEFAAAETEFLAAEEALGRANTLLQESQRVRTESEKASAVLELLRNRFQEADRTCRLGKELARHGTDLATAEQELREITERVQKARDRQAQAYEGFKLLEADWILGQSAILARDLVPGATCPVCGSTEHPSPAVSDRELPGEEELKQVRAEWDALRADVESLAQERLQCEKNVSRLSEAVKSAVEGMGEHAATPLPDLQRTMKKIRVDLRNAEASHAALARLHEEALRIEESVAEARKKHQEAQERKNSAHAKREAAAADVAARLSGIPEALQDMASLDGAKAAVNTTLVDLERSFTKSQQDLAAAEQGLAASLASFKASQAVEADARERAAVAREEFMGALTSAGFADEAGYRSSKRTKDEMRRLQEDIEQFDQALAAARDRAARADSAAAGLETPDMKALEVDASKARADLEQAQRLLVELEKDVEWRESRLVELARHAGELEALDRRYALLGRIAEVASGTNRDRTTFQRFVLAALLDEVLRAASERLLIMTNRRFSLQRVAVPADRRMASGLDLEVEDAYTGTCRPVSSLSGGESFLAALSLALGLADVVQAYSGGIRLDTIFVDEGFGNLDSEALDLALRALIDLQQSGRLVGIVSHVSELQERIDTRLEIVHTKVGSAAKFVFG